jgi:metallo-beta-lactamase class B
MTTHRLTLLCALGVVIASSVSGSPRQTTPRSAAAHVAAAKAAAGEEHTFLFDRLCNATAAEPSPPSARPSARPSAPSGPPRSAWHREPAKVFDNLYYVGEIEYSAWAIDTSDGIVILDAIFDYSVEEQIVGGLKTLGLDPARIKYVIVSHGHRDHVGGAKFLQDRFGARVLMSAEDWALVERTNASWKPRRDMVVTDGYRLTLGDTTLTLYVTPGHTLGTVSTIIPVKDGARTYTAAAWGGTAFNWLSSPAGYITPERPARFWFETYRDSARRFRDLIAKAGANVLISNHTNFDGSKQKIPALATRKAGDRHPYVIGTEGVQRYMTVAEQCAEAALLTLK